MAQNHYKVLGVGRQASADEVRAAYRKLVKEYHPDRNPAPDAHDKFIQVTQAYEALSDAERRRKYDEILDHEARRAAQREAAAASRPAPPRPQPQAQPAGRPSPAADAMQLTSLFGKGRYADAERLAQKLIQSNPRDPMPYAVLADIHKFRGELKRAAEMYSYAAQMAPGNPVYQRKHEEMLRALTRSTVREDAPKGGARVAPMLLGAVVVSVCAFYTAIANDRPLLPEVGMLNSFTFSLVLMLLIAGIALGAAMSASNVLEPFGATHSAAISSLPPTVMLGFVAAVNFWLAALMYLAISVAQRTVNSSTSRLIGGAIVVLFLISFAASYQAVFSQVLLWGGNLIYLGALVGWGVADSMRA